MSTILDPGPIVEFTPSMVMEMGYKRIKSIADRYGINSPETLAACERWGGILDDVNYPDTTCRNCGEALTHFHEANTYVHKIGESRFCKTHAGAEATPVKTTASGVGFIPTTAKKPLLKK